jgi:hypothetical protein
MQMIGKTLVLGCLLTIGPVALAAEGGAPAQAEKPATQPTPHFWNGGGEAYRGGGEAYRGGGEAYRGEAFRGRFRYGPPTEEEWNEVATFMQEHSPYRLEQIQKLKESAPYRYGLRAKIWNQYRTLQEQKRNDEQLYEFGVKRFELKDEQFHLVQQLERAKGEMVSVWRVRLHANAAELVALNLAERQHRLDKLVQAVETERQKLEQDKANQDQLIDEQLQQVVKHDPGSQAGRHAKIAENSESKSAEAK